MRLKYAFIKQLAGNYSIRRLCLTLKVHPSGYYAWLSEPKSARAKDDQRLLGLIKHSWLESGGVYGYRKIHDDLREVGESCGRHRVARLMRLEGLRSQTGYRRRPGKYGGKPAVASPNLLKRQFDVREPNKVWVTDITYTDAAKSRLLPYCWPSPISTARRLAVIGPTHGMLSRRLPRSSSVNWPSNSLSNTLIWSSR